MRQCFSVSLFIVALAAYIPAQTPSAPEGRRNNRCELWGQVVSPGGLAADGMEVELAGNSQVHRQRTHIVEGEFDFQPVPAGTYQFRLYDRSGRLILRNTQSLKGSNDEVILRIPYPSAEPVSANVVSLLELKHAVPRQAQEAFRNGMKAIDAGDWQKSIDYFQKAIVIDPRHVEAETNLAVLNNSMGRREEAIQHAQRAFEIDPGWAETGHTLAMLLILDKQYVQAEELARSMLASHQAVPEMHAVLAISLVGQRRSFDEAYGHLRIAAQEFPMARLLVANVLLEIGLPTVAAVQVNGYLRSAAHDCERESLERWFVRLDQSKSQAMADAR